MVFTHIQLVGPGSELLLLLCKHTVHLTVHRLEVSSKQHRGKNVEHSSSVSNGNVSHVILFGSYPAGPKSMGKYRNVKLGLREQKHREEGETEEKAKQRKEEQ